METELTTTVEADQTPADPPEEGDWGDEVELVTADEEEADEPAWVVEAEGEELPDFMDAEDVEDADPDADLPTDDSEQEGDEIDESDPSPSDPDDYSEDEDDPLTGGE